MADIISSDGLGLLDSFRTGLSRSHGLSEDGTRLAVNANNRNLVVQSRDELLVGTGLDTAILRTYNSQGVYNDNNQDGFRFSFEDNLRVAGNSVFRTSGDGYEQEYIYDAGSSTSSLLKYLRPSGDGTYDEVHYDVNATQFIWLDADSRLRQVYEQSPVDSLQWRLIERSDANGNTVHFRYAGGSDRVDRIWTDDGRVLALSYQSLGNGQYRVYQMVEGVLDVPSATGVFTAQASAVVYQYDGFNRLDKVLHQLLPGDSNANTIETFTTSYSYVTNTAGDYRVSEIRQDDGPDGRIAITTFEYSGASTDILRITSDGQTTEFSRSGNDTTIKYLLAGGGSDDYVVITDTNGRVTQTTSPTNSRIGYQLVTDFSYDADGNLASQSDNRGQAVYYAYDGQGNVLRQWNALSEVVEYSYNSEQQLRRETVYLSGQTQLTQAQLADTGFTGFVGSSRTVEYVYDANGIDIRFVIDSDGSVTEHRYTSVGNTTGIADSTRVYVEDSYSGSVTLSALEAWVSGLENTWSVGNAPAPIQLLDRTFNALGQLSSESIYTTINPDATGSGARSTQYFYAATTGALSHSIDADGLYTVHTRDAFGQIISTRLDIDTTEGDDADERVLFTVYANDSSQVGLSYALNADGTRTYSVYNEAGQLTQRYQSLVSVDALVNSVHLASAYFIYDSQGQLQAEHSLGQGPVIYLYDELGRQAGTIDAEGALTEQIYNASGQVTETIRYRQRLDVDRLATDFLTYSNNALSAVDEALTLTRLFDTGQTGGAYLNTDTSDRHERFVYDSAGRERFAIDAAGYVTETRYNAAGQFTDRIAYSASYNSAYDLAGLESFANASVLDTLKRATQFSYDAAGRLSREIDAEGFITDYAYNGAGQLVKTSRLNNISGAPHANDQQSYQLYDGAGQLVGQIDAEGYLTSWSYRDDGQVSKQTRYAQALTDNYSGQDPATLQLGDLLVDGQPLVSVPLSQQQSTIYTYNGINELVYELDQSAVFTEYTYDNAGRVATIHRGRVDSNSDGVLDGNDDIAARRLISDTDYDALGRVSQTQNGLAAANGESQIFQYDRAGRVISSTDTANHSTYYYYDNDGRQRFVVNALGHVTETRYNVFGEVSATIDYATPTSTAGLTGGALNASLLAQFTVAHANDRQTETSHTDRGLVDTVRDPESFLASSLLPTLNRNYNAFGEASVLARAIQQANNNDNDFRNTITSFDNRGLPISRIHAGYLDYTLTDLATESSNYDAFGRAILLTDSNGNVRQHSYDKLGRILAVMDALGYQTQTTYDAFDRLLTQTDASGIVTSYVYDDVNRTLTTTVTPNNGAAINTITSFNAHGEVVQIIDGDGHVTEYSYDANGNVFSTRVYDRLSDAVPISETQNSFDARNLLISSVDANGVVTDYVYDPLLRLMTVTIDPGTNQVVTSTAYNHTNRTVTTTNASGVVTVTSFDRNGRVSRIVEDSNGLSLLTIYSYDAEGLQIREERGDAVSGDLITYTVDYSYDSLGRRIAEVVDPNGLMLTTSYAYDDNGNVISRTGANGNITYFAYNARNEQVLSADPLGYVSEIRYDANGRATDQLTYRDKVATELAAWLAVNPNERSPGASDIAAFFIQQNRANGEYGQQLVANGSGDYAIDNQWSGTAIGHALVQGELALENIIKQGNTLSGGLNQTIDLSGFDAAVIDAGALELNFNGDYLAPPGTNVRSTVYFKAAGGAAIGSPVIVSAASSNGSWVAFAEQTITVPAGTRSAEISYTGFRPSSGKGGATPVSVDTPVYFDNLQAVANVNQLLINGNGDNALGTEWSGVDWTTGSVGGETSIEGTVRPGASTTSSLAQTIDLSGYSQDAIDAGLVSLTLDGSYLIESGQHVRWLLDFQDEAGGTVRFIAGTTNTGDGNWLSLASETVVIPAGASQVTVTYSGFVAQGKGGGTVAANDIAVHLDDLSITAQNLVGTGLPVVAHTRSVYDDFGRRTSQVTDPNGLALTTDYVYDANGNVVRATDANGRESYFAYNARNQLILTVDSLGYVSEIQYDPAGQVIDQRTYQESVSAELGVWLSANPGEKAPSASDIGAMVINLARQSAAFGQQLLANGDGNHGIDNQWSGPGVGIGSVQGEQGLVAVLPEGSTQSGALAQTVDLSGFSNTGNLKLVLKGDYWAPSGTRVRWTLNFRNSSGVLIGAPVTGSAGAGNGSWRSLTGQTMAVPVGTQAVEIAYTGFQPKPSKGSATPVAIDTPVYFNQLQVLAQDGGAAVAGIELVPLSARTQYVYNAIGRQRFAIDALGHVTEHRYDNRGNIIQTIAYSGQPVLDHDPSESDVEAAIVAVADSLQDQSTYLVYDAANRLRYQINAEGAVIENQYDALSRLMAEIHWANPVPVNAYHSEAAVQAQLNTNGSRVTRHYYDSAGRRLYTVDALGYVTAFTYDSVGKTVKRLRHHETIVVSAATTTAQVASLLAADIAPISDQQLNTVRDSGGRIVYEIDGQGRVTEYHYDGTGQIVTQIAYPEAIDVTLFSANPSVAEIAALLPANPNVTVDTITTDNGTTRNSLFHWSDTLPAGSISAHFRLSSFSAGTIVDIAPALNAGQNRYEANIADLSAGNYFYEIQYLDAAGSVLYTGLSIVEIPIGTGASSDSVAVVHRDWSLRQITQFTYDLGGRLVREDKLEHSGIDHSSEYGYDGLGNEISVVAARGIALAESDSDWASEQRRLLGYTVSENGTVRAKRASELSGAEKLTLKSLYTTTQQFDGVGRKSAATNALGDTATTVYDAVGNVVKVIDANGGVGYFYYNALSQLRFSVDPLGYVSEHIYDTFGNEIETIRYRNPVQLKAGADSDLTLHDLKILTTAPALGQEPDLYVLADSLDQHTSAQYDQLNRKLSVMDALSHTENFTYTIYDDLNTFIDKRGFTTSYVYDSLGRQTDQIQAIVKAVGQTPAETVSTRVVLDAFGNTMQLIEALGNAEQRSTTYVYDNSNRVVQVTLPEVQTANETTVAETMGFTGDSQQIGYTITITPIPKGPTLTSHSIDLSQIVGYGANISYRLLLSDGSSVSIPAGQASWTGGSLPVQIPVNLYAITASGETLVAQFNASNGSVTPATLLGLGNIDASAASVKMDVWPSGNVDAITTYTRTVNNQQADIGFDLNETGSFEFAGYLLDSTGGFIKEFSGAYAISTGQLTVTRIDDSVLLSAVSSAPQTSRSYDGLGNLSIESDANGGVTHHYYDGLNRRIATVDAERYLHEYKYDHAGNLLLERSYDEAVAAGFDLDQFTPTSSNLAGGVTSYRESSYSYDAANRILTSSTGSVYVYDRVNGGRSESLVTGHMYDATGNVVRITHPNGAYRFAYYDANNNLIAEVDPEGYFVSYRYDANNNVVEQTRYASQLSVVTLSVLSVSSNPYLLEAELIALNNSNDRVTAYTYDGLNRVITQSFVGISYDSFDAGGNRQPLTGNQVTTYQYDESNNVTAVIDATGGRVDVQYDGLRRQTLEENPYFTDYLGNSVRERTEWQYDALGNILSETRLGSNDTMSDDDQITGYLYDASGNTVLETNAEGGTINYYYDHNGNLVRQLEQRRDPDNELPSITTQYTYDRLDQLIATQDARSFETIQRYNAYGEIVARGVADDQGNVIGDVEYFVYDRAGRLINTNQDDGVERAYLYDAEGNATAEIVSVVDPAASSFSLKNMAIESIAALSDGASVSRKEYLYDANNRRISEIQSAYTVSQLQVDPNNLVSTWVDVLGDPFSGGSIVSVPIEQGSFTNNASASKYGVYFNFALNFPPINGLGDGDLHLRTSVPGFPAATTSYYAAYDATSMTGNSLIDGDPSDGSNTSLYKSTAFGDVLITDFSDAMLVSSGFYNNAGTYNFSLGGKLRITGQPNTATSLTIKLWQGDQNNVPASGVDAVQMIAVDANNVSSAVPGWFESDVGSYPEGTYYYQYEAKDNTGAVIANSTVRGEVVIGANATVISQELLTFQPQVIGGLEEQRQVQTQTEYNAFGEIIAETDGRGYALAYRDTEWAKSTRVDLGYAQLEANLSAGDRAALQGIYTNQLDYDNRGNLIRKIDAETDVTLEDGSQVRHRPTTEFYYDIAGRSIAAQDAVSLQYANREYYTRNEYDAAGHLVKETYADGGEKEFGFDKFGNRRWQDNELDIRTSFEFNKLNQLTRMNLPTDTTFNNVDRHEEYLYDFQDRRIARRNANDDWEYFFYDDIGRVVVYQDTQGTVTSYDYDFNSATGGYTRTTKLADGLSAVDVTDYFGRALSHTDLGGRTYTYQYNAAGWLIHQQSDFGATASDTGQSIDYSFYSNGLVKEITDNTVGTRNYYEYDENGNRTIERYATLDVVNPVYYQWSEGRYDELNRLVNVNDTAPNANYEVDYAFDANGNRMHLHARYYQQADTNRTLGTQDVQDYWYRYDALNRFVVTKGVLDGAPGSGVIKSGDQGYVIGYNQASQRISQEKQDLAGTVLEREAYVYNVGGLLTQTYVDMDPASNSKTVYEADRQLYDAVGNLLQYRERQGSYLNWVWGNYSWQGTSWSNIRSETNTYRADGKRNSNVYTSYASNGSVDRTLTTTYNYDVAGNLQWTREVDPGQTAITTHYSYAFWDSAKQTKIVKNGDVLAYTPNGPWKEGFSEFTYNANGHLKKVVDHEHNNGQGRSLQYTLDQQGKILRRQELVGTASNAAREQNYFYFNNIGIGDAGTFGDSQIDYATHLVRAARDRGRDGAGEYNIVAVSSADFEYNFRPINDTYPASTPGTHTVAQNGELLSAIALQLWGDASLWYLLADANGLQGGVDPGLIEGQTLVVPNVVTNIHNNSSTFKPYDPFALQGNVQPTLPDAPPPRPKKSGGGCGKIFALILVIVVVAIVTWGVGSVLTTALGGTLGPLATAGVAAASAAIGSIAGQLVGIGLGLQQGFDWKGVAIAAVTAGITSGLGGLDLFGGLELPTAIHQAANAVVRNFVSQGISVALGQQKGINWIGVAAAGLAAPITAQIDSALGVADTPIGAEFSFSEVARNTVSALSHSVVQQSIAIGLGGNGRIDWVQTAANAVGQGLATSITNDLEFSAGRRRAEKVAQQMKPLMDQVTDELARSVESIGESNYQQFADDFDENVITPQAEAIEQSNRARRQAEDEANQQDIVANALAEARRQTTFNEGLNSRLTEFQLDLSEHRVTRQKIDQAFVEAIARGEESVRVATAAREGTIGTQFDIDPEALEFLRSQRRGVSNGLSSTAGSSGGPATNAATFKNGRAARLDSADPRRPRSKSPFDPRSLGETRDGADLRGGNVQTKLEATLSHDFVDDQIELRFLDENNPYSDNFLLAQGQRKLTGKGAYDFQAKEAELSLEGSLRGALVHARTEVDLGPGTLNLDASTAANAQAGFGGKVNRHGVHIGANASLEAVALQLSGEVKSDVIPLYFFDVTVGGSGDVNVLGIGGKIGGGGSFTKSGFRFSGEAGLTALFGARVKGSVDVKFNTENIESAYNYVSSYFD